MSAPSSLLFVCRECSRRCDGPDLRKYLKKRLKQDGWKKKELRVVRTECMGLCPDEGVSVCESGGEPEVVRPERDREELYERLVDLVAAR